MRLIQSNIAFCIYLILIIYYTDIRILYGQENTSSGINNEIETLFPNKINEKVYLHTDRLFYLTGEKIWFRIYLLVESTLEPYEFSRVAYVELLDSRNNAVVRQKIKTGQSGGCGYLEIPVNIHSGYYYMRAYTHWMKNFKPSDYFIAALAIVNPNTSLYETTDTLIFSGNDNINVEFFPEGGKLINGVECLTAVRALNSGGRPVQVRGVVSSSGDSSIVEFSTGSNGMGSFRFIPEEGKNYSARISIPENDDEIYYLPESENTGMVLQVISKNISDLSLRINGNNQEIPTSALYRIMVINRKGMTYMNDLSIRTLPCYLQISSGDLAEGVNRLILINGNGEIQSERCLFIKPHNQLDIRISNNALIYGSRKNVEFEIITYDAPGHPVPSDISVSVFFTGDKEFNTPGIQDYLFLYSGVHPELTVQGLTCREKLENPDTLTDQLMLAESCSGLPDSNFLYSRGTDYLYFAEMEGTTVSGIILDPATKNPVSDIPVILSIVGEDTFLKSFMTRNDGRFYFCLDNMSGEKNIVLSYGNPSSDLLIILDEPYSTTFTELPDLQLELDESWRSFIERQMINLQLNTIYETRYKPDFTSGKQKTVPFYIKPDFTIRMEDFVRLPNMEEVFRELVKQVIVSRENGQLKLNILDYNTNRIIGPNPVFIVDGVPVFDSQLIFEMNPEDISQIDIVSYKYYKDILEMDGIIDIRTNQGNFPISELPGNTFRQAYQTYQPDHEYIIPDYMDEQKLKSRIPDFRNLLYWNPSVRTGQDGKARISFYTSDNAGKYSIRIEGMSADGIFGTTTESLKVVKQ